MKQACLCKYLSIRCNHPDTLLRIPASIRQRIYLYAGLIVNTYTAYPNIGPISREENCKRPSEDYMTTRSLLLTCRQISEEVEAILCNQNTYVYTDDDVDDGLHYLSQINPYLCSMLRDVHVCLHIQGYHEPGPPLEWKRIERWQAAVTNILSHASPQQLRLHLICETGEGERTTAVLQPFSSFPGVLFELELLLGPRRFMDSHEQKQTNEKLATLARETVLGAQGRNLNTPLEPFRFFDLPKEIRLSIFAYTNLTAPYRKVHWDPENGFYTRFIFTEYDEQGGWLKDLHHDHRLEVCGSYSEVTGNFCMRDHASYSSRCSHGFSPLSLVLTSREMYEETIAFFYASNRIVILPAWNPDGTMFARAPTTGRADPEDLDLGIPFRPTEITYDATNLFLEKIGSRSAGLIRTLEIAFPWIGPPSSLLDTDPAYRDWCKAIDYLAHLGTRTDVQKLTLIVYIWTTPSGRCVWPLKGTAYHLKTQSHRLLKPLRALPQLERLFVHLEWPRHWSPLKAPSDKEVRRKPRSDRRVELNGMPGSNEAMVEKEMELEKIVMGARYNSFSVGKGDELPSQWLPLAWHIEDEEEYPF